MDKAEKFWDRLSDKFDKRARPFEEKTSKIIENTKRHLSDRDIVLDYGCATGRITCDLAGQVKEIQGLDISSRMIEAAKARAGDRKTEHIDFVKGTIFDERYQTESYDVILGFNILHLVEDTHQVLQRINELLKPGGLLLSATPCLRERKTFASFLLFLLLLTLTKIRIIPHMQFFTWTELQRAITEESFQITETTTLSVTPLEYFVVARKI